MARNASPEFKELEAIIRQERELEERSRTQKAEQRRLAERRKEQAMVVPPLKQVEYQTRIREYEFLATRGHLKNQRREQGRSLLLLILLTCATASMLWWGIRIMQG